MLRQAKKGTKAKVVYPNGNVDETGGSLLVCMGIDGVNETIEARVAPSFEYECVFGMDGANRFGFQVDYGSKYWRLPGLPIHPFKGEAESGNRKIGKDEPSHGTDKRDSACAGLSELTEDQAQELERFLKARLSPPSKYPRAISLVEHHIDVRGHPPIKQRYRNYSPKITEYMNKELDQLLKADMVEPSASEWSNPNVMVTKSDGTYRMCLDFRKVNEVAKKDAYPLPHMDAILSKLRSARYITTIDLSKAFHQIPVARNSREYTAFTVPGRGLYIVNEHGLQVDPDKVQGIKEYAAPKTIKQLRRFLGIVSWYTRGLLRIALQEWSR